MGWVKTFCFSRNFRKNLNLFSRNGGGRSTATWRIYSNSLPLDLLIFDTFVTQVNHPSGKEKKGSVLGRFLGRKKVNTWVDACLGQLCNSTFGSDMQTTEDYYACPVTSNSIILTLWNPLLYKYSGRNTRWKWQQIFLNLMKYSSPWTRLYPTLLTVRIKWDDNADCFTGRKSIYFYAVELLRCCWKFRQMDLLWNCVLKLSLKSVLASVSWRTSGRTSISMQCWVVREACCSAILKPF